MKFVHFSVRVVVYEKFENVSQQSRSLGSTEMGKEPLRTPGRPLSSLPHAVANVLGAEHLTIKLESIFKELSGRT